MRRHALRCALLVAAGAALAAAQEPGQPVTVHLRDGTRIPLQDWALHYEYVTWPKGSSPAMALSQQSEVDELYVGKRTLPVAGATLEFGFDHVPRSREVDGRMTGVEVLQPASIQFVEAGGKRHEFERPDPPHKDRVTPGLDKNRLFQARGLYLSGQTLTGTRRTYCLFPYTTLVECSEDPGLQVARIEFP